MFEQQLNAVRRASLRKSFGVVREVLPQGLRCTGMGLTVGQTARIWLAKEYAPVLCEVARASQSETLLTPLAPLDQVPVGARVEPAGQLGEVQAGTHLLGRVIDPLGQPLDDRPLVSPGEADRRAAQRMALNPMRRPSIDQQLITGVRAIDALLPLGQGQRVGIFAGSGVGKSTLLGMLARDVQADVSVIALIGERGREVRDFVDDVLGKAGLARSVLVVATAEQPAALRMRAAHVATSIAEGFRAQGQSVLLMMDSLTRVAMARREIGLMAGEPPTARGYTPSVFAELPQLCERAGTAEGGGSITALYTVLVEGDDFNEPVSDLARATLDGHIMLTRELAHEAHYPAIDVLQSVSRLAGRLQTEEQRALGQSLLDALSLYQRNKAVVEMGVYRAGTNPALDRVLELRPEWQGFLRQAVDERSATEATWASLKRLVARLNAPLASSGERITGERAV